MTEEEFYLVDLKSKFDKIKPNTYYLSYSGGKDSHFLYWFIKEYLKRDDIKIVGINTYMEHHEILERIKKNCDEVLLPELRPFEIKEKYGSPCFSKIQDEYIDRYQKGCRTESLMSHIYPRKFIGRDGKEHNSSFVLNNTARRLLLSGELHRVMLLLLKKEDSPRLRKKNRTKSNTRSKIRRRPYEKVTIYKLFYKR